MKNFALIFILIFLEGCVSNAFPVSDHFDGSSFHNLDPKVETSKSFVSLLKWKFGPAAQEWPKELVKDAVAPDIAKPIEGDGLRITFINHATVLIQWKSINILTDPVLSEKLGPLSVLNLKRYRDPGLTFENMPKIDYIFVSHNHYDHLDLPTIEKFEQRDHPKYILPLGVGEYLPKSAQDRVTELDWWESFKDETRALEITFVPSQHWSRRGVFDTNKSLWGAAVFRANGRSVYFGGDTGYAEHFKMTYEKLGAMDVSLLPIGAYEPRWFMKESHMNPDDAIQAHRDLHSKRSIGIHFGTFKLTNEGIEDPGRDLKAGLSIGNLSAEDFEVPRNGQTFSL